MNMRILALILFSANLAHASSGQSELEQQVNRQRAGLGGGDVIASDFLSKAQLTFSSNPAYLEATADDQRNYRQLIATSKVTTDAPVIAGETKPQNRETLASKLCQIDASHLSDLYRGQITAVINDKRIILNAQTWTKNDPVFNDSIAIYAYMKLSRFAPEKIYRSLSAYFKNNDIWCNHPGGKSPAQDPKSKQAPAIR